MPCLQEVWRTTLFALPRSLVLVTPVSAQPCLLEFTQRVSRNLMGFESFCLCSYRNTKGYIWLMDLGVFATLLAALPVLHKLTRCLGLFHNPSPPENGVK